MKSDRVNAGDPDGDKIEYPCDICTGLALEKNGRRGKARHTEAAILVLLSLFSQRERGRGSSCQVSTASGTVVLTNTHRTLLQEVDRLD